MILDTLSNAAVYSSLHKHFDQAFAFLRNIDLENLPVGRHEIDGDRMYALMAKDTGRGKDKYVLEAHRKYIDIQMVIAGSEEMGWKPLARCKSISSQYDEKKDIVFFSDKPDSWLTVLPGQFVIFFPEDTHMPLISNSIIHKAVIKIAVA